MYLGLKNKNYFLKDCNRIYIFLRLYLSHEIQIDLYLKISMGCLNIFTYAHI